jgi:hypothetical protein
MKAKKRVLCPAAISAVVTRPDVISHTLLFHIFTKRNTLESLVSGSAPVTLPTQILAATIFKHFPHYFCLLRCPQNQLSVSRTDRQPDHEWKQFS